MLTEEDSLKVIDDMVHTFIENPYLSEHYEIKILKEVNSLKRQELVEKHLMSTNLLNNYTKGALIVSKDKEMSIMVNEEDHIRIQCIKNGLNLDEAFENASNIDDFLEEKMEYAFDERLGFLTSCVTNLGTGLRASVMMHLPGLRMIGELKNMIQTLSKIGLTVRGAYGEGSEALGNMFQISNQITLGVSEKDIILAVKNIIHQIVDKEKKARSILFEKDKVLIEDKIFRSYGVLRNARILSYKESMMLLSDVILGVDLGLLNEVNNLTLHHIINSIQPASLQLLYNQNFSDRERDIKRAELIGDLL